MGETLEEQFQKAIKKKNEQGESSDTVEMAKKALDKKANSNTIEPEGINTVTSEEIFGKEQQEDPEKKGKFKLEGLFAGNEGTKPARESYEKDIRAFITEKGAETPEEVGQAVEEYFEKNKAKGKTQTGKMILSNLEQMRLAKETNTEEKQADEITEVEEEERKDKDVKAPKTLEEFKSKFEVSRESEKKFYNNDKTGVDLEISGYDPKKGEVSIVFHEHSKIESQEDGNNVLVLDEEPDKKKEKSRSEKMPYTKFQAMMKDYVVQGSQVDESVKPKKIEGESNEHISIVPGKTYRNEKGEKIKILKLDPKRGETIRVGEAHILKIIPEKIDGKDKIKNEWSYVKVEELKRMLAEESYRRFEEPQTKKKRRTGEEKKDTRKEEQEVELEPEKTLEIEKKRDEPAEEGNNELNKVLNKEKKEQGDEQEKKEQLDEKELEAIESIYLPYAQECLDMINAYKPDGYKEEDVERFRQEEKKRFFSADGGVLASRIAESEFIRKEAVEKAVEYVQATVEQEPAEDYSI